MNIFYSGMELAICARARRKFPANLLAACAPLHYKFKRDRCLRLPAIPKNIFLAAVSGAITFTTLEQRAKNSVAKPAERTNFGPATKSWKFPLTTSLKFDTQRVPNLDILGTLVLV